MNTATTLHRIQKTAQRLVFESTEFKQEDGSLDVAGILSFIMDVHECSEKLAKQELKEIIYWLGETKDITFMKNLIW